MKLEFFSFSKIILHIYVYIPYILYEFLNQLINFYFKKNSSKYAESLST